MQHRTTEQSETASSAARTADDYPQVKSNASNPGTPMAAVKPGSPLNGRRPSHTGSATPMGMADARRASLASDQGPDAKPSTSSDFNLTMRAATTIGRAWRKRTRGFELDKKNFVERLILEDDMCIGVTRLVLFVVLFVVLYTVTLIGVPSAERRAAEIVLSQALGLEEFEAVRTLPAFREGMVKFSQAMKEFSASGSQRFLDKESIVVLGSAQSFTKPKPLSGLDLKVSAEEFTITAWVEVTDESHGEKPLLRKPLHTHPELSCWGWYFPGKMVYGAHDYHSVGMDMEHLWQDGVDSGVESPTEFFNHEAIVVHNHTATFYRNGKVSCDLPRALTALIRISWGLGLAQSGLPDPNADAHILHAGAFISLTDVPSAWQILNPGGTKLLRTITDCLGTIEVGGAGLRISSMKFYAREHSTRPA